jgi:hypothetical protein
MKTNPLKIRGIVAFAMIFAFHPASDGEEINLINSESGRFIYF